jgi:hypothetical protein
MAGFMSRLLMVVLEPARVEIIHNQRILEQKQGAFITLAVAQVCMILSEI